MKRSDKCEIPTCGKFFTVDNPCFARGPMIVDGEMRDFFICKECNDRHNNLMKEILEHRDNDGHVQISESMEIKNEDWEQ